MRRLKVLLAVGAAMAMLLTATSLATATPILGTAMILAGLWRPTLGVLTRSSSRIRVLPVVRAGNARVGPEALVIMIGPVFGGRGARSTAS